MKFFLSGADNHLVSAMLPQRRGFEQKRRNYLCTRRGEHFQEAAGHHGREKKKNGDKTALGNSTAVNNSMEEYLIFKNSGGLSVI